MSLSESKSVKEFIGLYCVNNSSPSDLTILRAYLQQYEKFEKENYYLDSAFVYLSKIPLEMCTSEWIKFYFFSLDFNGLVNWFERASFESRTDQLNKRSYTNDDAWSWYRVGESYYKTKNYEKASTCFEQASLLAPFHLEIQNKFGMALLKCNRLKEAQKVFEFVRSENPNFEKVYANYGYLFTILGEFDQALLMYEKGIALNPDIVQLWMNLAAYYLHFQNIENAQNSLLQVLRIKPNHKRAQQLLNQIK
jgi:tetratricopeptide (TPR) repeat protein